MILQPKYTFLIITLLISGCAMFEPVGENLGKGLVSGVSTQADTVGGKLGGGVITGLRDSLASARTRQQLAELLTMLGDTLNAQVRSLRDSLFGSYLRLWLQEVRNDLLGQSTRAQVAALRDELIGENTRAQVAMLRNELLGDSTRAYVASLRNELLGPATRAAVDSLVGEAIASIEKGYKERIRPLAREEEGWLRNNITTVLIVIGLIIAALIVLGGYVYIQKQKYRKVIEVVTEQIDSVEDKKQQDVLKRKIKEKAVQEGVETSLREVLKKQ